MVQISLALALAVLLLLPFIFPLPCRYRDLHFAVMRDTISSYTDIMHIFLCRGFDNLPSRICWEIVFGKLAVDMRRIHFCVFVLLCY